MMMKLKWDLGRVDRHANEIIFVLLFLVGKKMKHVFWLSMNEKNIYQ
jgi:hypothetical protein